jgi:hypothetical protein
VKEFNHQRFAAAYDELRCFLRRVDPFARATKSLGEDDLRSGTQRIANLAPDVGYASRSAAVDKRLQKLYCGIRPQHSGATRRAGTNAVRGAYSQDATRNY